MRTTLYTLQVIIAAVVFSTSINLQAAPNGHYRWTDAEGTVQHSDRPPKGVEAEFIKFSTGKSKATPTDSTSEPEIGADGKPVKEALGGVNLEGLPKKDPALCKQAQHNLKALDGARIRMTDEDGSQRFLTEEEKESQRDNARKFIKIHC